MDQRAYEKAFAQRKAEYQEQLKALFAQMTELKKQFHAGNAKLEEERRASIQANPKSVRKHECYQLQNRLGGLLQEWTGTKQLDASGNKVHFDCCGDEVAVFTITIPYKTNEK